MGNKGTFLYYCPTIMRTLSEHNIEYKIKNDEIQCCCPFHEEKKPSFGISAHTGLYHCFSCGASGNIVQFISKMDGISESDAKKNIEDEVGFVDINSIPYSLSEFATEKHLSEKFLEENHIEGLNNVVVFPYYDEEHQLVRARYRRNPKSDIRFVWDYGEKMCLYGLWKLASFKKDYIVLVEGETDSLSLWYHDMPALGVPGANNFKKEYSKLFKDFNKVIIHIEGDEASQQFMKKICQSGIPFEKLYKFSSKEIDEKCKDPADLHKIGKLGEKLLLDNLHKIDKDYFDEVTKGQRATQIHTKIAEEVLEQMYIKFYNGNFYVYESGVYKEGLAKIEQEILAIDKNLKKSTRNEILDYLRIIKGVTVIKLDENLINFKNGIYHIDTGTLEPHTPDLFTICQINARYLSDDELKDIIQSNQNEYIDNFLDDICCGHINRINSLLEFIGYSMTYSVKLATCLFLVGETAGNGKSTFNKLVIALFGDNNYCSIGIEEFSERFFGAELVDKLLNIIHEVKNITVKDIAKFKAVVSGDEISVEEKYKPRYKIKPFAHHIFAMNNLPEIKDGDEGFYRRLLIIPFEAKFSDEQQDKFDFSKLVTDSSLDYLANTSLRQYLKMRSQKGVRFANSNESNDLIESYKRGDNSANIFLNDISNFAYLIDSNNKLKVKMLYDEYIKWCQSGSFEQLSKREFKQTALSTGEFKKAPMQDGYECFIYINNNNINISNYSKPQFRKTFRPTKFTF